MNSFRRYLCSARSMMSLLLLLVLNLSPMAPNNVVVDAWTTHPSSSVMLRARRTTARSSTRGSMAVSASASTMTTTTTSPLQASSTVELSYTEWTTATTPTDPPVVFLHGLLGNKKNFASLARSLALQLKTQRRIFGLDMRNHGDSAAADHLHVTDMSYASMAADVVAFLDKLELDQVVLVGHSMGGKIAQAVALRYPHRVHGLVVLDMAPVSYDEQADSTWSTVCSIVRQLDAVVSDDAVQTKKQVDLALRTTIPDPALRAFCLTNWHDAAGRWKIPMDVIKQQLPTLAAFEIDDTINGHNNHQEQFLYTGDAFFIHGGQSRFVRHAHLPAIRQYFPNHMLTTIRGSGHWVHAEAPENTLSLLLQFLDR